MLNMLFPPIYLLAERDLDLSVLLDRDLLLYLLFDLIFEFNLSLCLLDYSYRSLELLLFMLFKFLNCSNVLTDSLFLIIGSRSSQEFFLDF